MPCSPPAGTAWPTMRADDVGRAAGVVPHGARLVDQRQRAAYAAMSSLPGAVQHLDAVADRVVDVVLDELQPRAHLEQLLERDRLLRRAPPRGDRRRRVDVEQAVADGDADRGVRDALGHAPRDQRRVGVDRPAGAEDRVGLRAVALEHHLAAVLHDQRQRHAVRRIGREQFVGNVGTTPAGPTVRGVPSRVMRRHRSRPRAAAARAGPD